MRKPDVAAVVVADLHLSSKPPIARAGEDWWAVQAGYCRQLREVAKKHSAPVVCTGDVFDRWNSSSELVNFAIKHLPKMYAVAGNHDLPYHSADEIGKSSYWTLVEAGRVVNVALWEDVGPLRLWGFPYGFPPKPPEEPKHSLVLDVAVVHAYLWTDKAGHPGARGEQKLGAYLKKLKGYDVALFGDNHTTIGYNCDKRFPDQPSVFNPGGFLRRKSDERNHKPCLGLLHTDGKITRHYLDTGKDQWAVIGGAGPGLDSVGVQTFVDALLDLGDAALDYRRAVDLVLAREKVPDEVKRIILAAMGDGK